MGTYDTLHEGRRVEQLKLWGKGLRHLHVGDRVGLPRGGLATEGTYTVVMRAGGYVHVVDGVITGWVDEPGPGPRLTTGGSRYQPEDWPGGRFGPWYRDADAPAHQRLFDHSDDECPRLSVPALRPVGSPGAVSGLELARAAALADVSARLAAGPAELERLAAVRPYLADGTGYRAVNCEAIAGLLGIPADGDRAGERLVQLVSSAEADAEWSNAAAMVAHHAAVLPTSAVSACLVHLAGALVGGEPSDEAPEPPDAVAQPAMRRPRVAAREDALDRLGRYGDLDFRAAVEAAVARHGAAVLPAVPLRFWGRDVVVTELAAPLLEPVLGRPFTPEELDRLLDALLDVSGDLGALQRQTLREALERADT